MSFSVFTCIGSLLLYEPRQWGSQLERTFVPKVEGWVLKSKLRQTKVVETGSDSSTAERSAKGVSVKGPRS